MRTLVHAFILTAILSMAWGQGFVSEYAEGKIYTRSGFTIEGKHLRMTMESATLEVAGQDQVLQLDDIVQVMAKKGKSKRYGRNCGMLALGLNTLSYLANGGKYEDEDGVEQTTEPLEFVVGAVMFGGLSYGVGYLAGMLTDDWEMVYLKRN